MTFLSCAWHMGKKRKKLQREKKESCGLNLQTTKVFFSSFGILMSEKNDDCAFVNNRFDPLFRREKNGSLSSARTNDANKMRIKSGDRLPTKASKYSRSWAVFWHIFTWSFYVWKDHKMFQRGKVSHSPKMRSCMCNERLLFCQWMAQLRESQNVNRG